MYISDKYGILYCRRMESKFESLSKDIEDSSGSSQQGAVQSMSQGQKDLVNDIKNLRYVYFI